jgi:hypothetical protein
MSDNQIADPDPDAHALFYGEINYQIVLLSRC